MSIWRILHILAVALATMAFAGSAGAQSASGKGPFGTGQTTTAEVGFAPNILQRASAWVLEKQTEINRELAGAVRRLKTADPFSAGMTLAFLSFAYGVLHAAGPGHGKAVITSYVLADGRTVRRGILLAFLAAIIQALSALVLVSILVLAFRATGVQIRSMEAWLETLSWGLVALVGGWLLYYQLRAGFTRAPAHAHDHHHGHDHHEHAHAQQDESCEICAHVPDPNQLKGDWSWSRALALAFAVGVRPCTGAILVLIFAIGQGLLWAGVFSTFAMAIGTAITVSVLAASAVGFRQMATRLAGTGSRWTARIQRVASIGGASLVLLLGSAFFLVSLNGMKPF